MTNDPKLPSPTARRPQNSTLSQFLEMPSSMTHDRGISDNSHWSSSIDTAPSSRSSTPDSVAPLTVNFRKADVDRNWNEKPENTAAAQALVQGDGEDVRLVVGAAGRLPEEVYERTLSWWRAGLRRVIMRNIEWESKVLATMQVCLLL